MARVDALDLGLGSQLIVPSQPLCLHYFAIYPDMQAVACVPRSTHTHTHTRVPVDHAASTAVSLGLLCYVLQGGSSLTPRLVWHTQSASRRDGKGSVAVLCAAAPACLCLSRHAGNPRRNDGDTLRRTCPCSTKQQESTDVHGRSCTCRCIGAASQVPGAFRPGARRGKPYPRAAAGFF